MTTVDAEAAAVAMGVSARTIQRWVRDGKVANAGSPRHILIELDELHRCRLECARMGEVS